MTLNVGRSNQETIDFYRAKQATETGARGDKKTKLSKSVSSSSQDIVFQLIHIGLRFTMKTEKKN